MKSALVLIGFFVGIAGAQAAGDLNVDRLPYQWGVPCYITRAEVGLVGRFKYLIVYNEADGYEKEYDSRRLVGESAVQVRSADLRTVQHGPFPKCAVVLN